MEGGASYVKFERLPNEARNRATLGLEPARRRRSAPPIPWGFQGCPTRERRLRGTLLLGVLFQIEIRAWKRTEAMGCREVSSSLCPELRCT